MNNTFDTNINALDQTRHTGLLPKLAPGRAATQITMPSSDHESLARSTGGLRIGSLLVFKQLPYQKLVVGTEDGKVLQAEGALQAIVSELKGLAANAADGDMASAIAASIEVF